MHKPKEMGDGTKWRGAVVSLAQKKIKNKTGEVLSIKLSSEEVLTRGISIMLLSPTLL